MRAQIKKRVICYIDNAVLGALGVNLKQQSVVFRKRISNVYPKLAGITVQAVRQNTFQSREIIARFRKGPDLLVKAFKSAVQMIIPIIHA